MDSYDYPKFPYTTISRPVGKTTMSKMAVTRTPDGRTTISRMPIYRSPFSRTPITHCPWKAVVVKGKEKLFPRVVLEDCVSFKKKYENLFETERRRMVEREERDEREMKEVMEREAAMERAREIEMETDTDTDTDTDMESAPVSASVSQLASTSQLASASQSSSASASASASASVSASASASASTSASASAKASESTPEMEPETAMETAMETATETAMEPATESVEDPSTGEKPHKYCITFKVTNSPTTGTEDAAIPSTSTAVPSTSTEFEPLPSTSAEATPGPSTSTGVRRSSRKPSPRKLAESLTPPRRPSPRKSTTRKSATRRKSTTRKSAAAGQPVVKKFKSWDPTQDFEIERIVGYHRDRFDRMWYYVQWKGWSDDYNTYEPIENMTGCNYLLMKYFEYKKPSDREFNAKDREITAMLDNYEMHQRLIESNFKKEDLDEFSRTCLDISKMFKKGSFVQFCKATQREFNYIIRCLIGMCNHQDQGLIERAMNYKIALKMIKLRRKQLRENLATQRQITRLESTEVKIENYTDLDVFPKEVTYVVDLKPGQNVVIPTDPTVGCECERGCSAKSHCCGEMASTLFAYNKFGRVRSLDRFAIYECNRRCTCPPQCVNRVVQHGMKVKLCIFKTEACGWGVKTLERIPKGAFICEYIGELISDADAVVRDIDYYKKNSSYIFDLDFSPDHDTNMYCIDATKYGNLARFINHSCDPNLVVYPVWIDCLEPNLHRLAFFARRPIKKNEELCIDYENAQEGHVPRLSKEEQEKKSQRTLRTLSRIRCQCGADRCREWVFGN